MVLSFSPHPRQVRASQLTPTDKEEASRLRGLLGYAQDTGPTGPSNLSKINTLSKCALVARSERCSWPRFLFNLSNGLWLGGGVA